jgi:rubrerythrin
MSEMFNVSELVQVAVEDEKSGVAFYGDLAQRAGTEELRAVFAKLADEERVHQKRFEEMLRTMGAPQAPEGYEDEYVGYLRALTADRAFPDVDAATQAAAQCADDAAAVALAIRFEKDTLILMEEMQKLVRQRDQAVVEELADEERQHLVTLEEARKTLRA